MRLPKKIKVLGVPYDVVLVGALEDVNPDKNEYLYGVCLNNTKEIRVWSGGPDEFTAKVLLHEVLHACLNESGVTTQDNETLVCRLTDSLYSTLPTMDIQWRDHK